MDRYRVAVVIPAFNEEKTIAGVVKASLPFGIPIVIDDNSSDKTAKLALNAGAVVLSHKKNLGYDEAINSGFKYAAKINADVAITIDADAQHNPLLIKKLIDLLSTGHDVALGARRSKQRFSEHIFSWYTFFFFGIKDPLSGLKAYRMKLFRKMSYFDSYKSCGTEMVIFAAKNKYSIGQFDFDVLDREDESRFGNIIKANYKIIRALLLSLWKIK